MREIKFRVWNPELKEMYILSKKEYLGGTGIYDDSVGHDKSVWMQFTGLHDRNGREIYEGDIVKGRYYDNFSRKEFDIVCIVRWDKSGYWTFDGRDKRFTGGYLTDIRDIEVVGNKYENPEWLEEIENE